MRQENRRLLFERRFCEILASDYKFSDLVKNGRFTDFVYDEIHDKFCSTIKFDLGPFLGKIRFSPKIIETKKIDDGLIKKGLDRLFQDLEDMMAMLQTGLLIAKRK